MTIPQHNTDLRGCGAFLCKLADLIDDLVGRDFEPGGCGARVGDRGGGNAFSIAVKPTHCGGLVVGSWIVLVVDFSLRRACETYRLSFLAVILPR